MLDGLLLINKPEGISSSKITAFVKSTLSNSQNAKVKVGHCGTLDLEASGLLILILGKATRLERFLHFYKKTYSGEIRLGIQTNTDDISGEIINSASLPILSSLDFEKLKEKFTGTFLQQPPVVSAKKIDGKIAYKEARKGNNLELKPKLVSAILEKLEIFEENTLYYKVSVSSGFYVRSLARDIGLSLNSFACAKTIIREQIGPFSLYDSNCTNLNNFNITGEEIEKNIISLKSICSNLEIAKSNISADDAALIRNGNKNILEKLDLIHGFTLLTVSAEPIAIVSKDNSLLKYECVL